MEDTRQILLDSASRLFAELEVPAGEPGWGGASSFDAQWVKLAEFGLPFALLDEDSGGFGIDMHEALSLVRLAGRFALALPLADTMIVNYLLVRAGLEAVDDPAVLAPLELSIERHPGHWHLSGNAGVLPWAGQAKVVLATAWDADGKLYLVRLPIANIDATRETVAGIRSERFAVDVMLDDDAVATMPVSPETNCIQMAGAAIRAISMAGAIERIVEMTAGYVNDREQFGRPLSKFQVIQHDIAKMACQSAAANAAAELAMDGIRSNFHMPLVATAKSRAGEAAGQVAALSHQLHGAIGVTAEYRLHRLTRLLWQWRDEFGTENYWNGRLAQAALSASGLWSFVTGLEEIAS